MPRRSIEPGTIDKFRRRCGLRRPNRLRDAGTSVALDHGHQSLFDHDQHCDHFPDPLACKILEIARLIDADNVILHILREAVVVIVVQRRGEGTCAVVNSLCRRENFLGCRFHALDGGPEFAGRARHPAVIAIVGECSKLTHVAKDDRLDGCELSRQLRRFRRLLQFCGDSPVGGVVRWGR